ncbi:hypothetical protein ME782_14880 [Lactobacillus delbrueckii]|nr:hypothetical protein ME782_14880 [Lactobacillus delbrueckii]
MTSTDTLIKSLLYMMLLVLGIAKKPTADTINDIITNLLIDILKSQDFSILTLMLSNS